MKRMQFLGSGLGALFKAMFDFNRRQASGPQRHRTKFGQGKKRYWTTNANGERVKVPASSSRPAAPYRPATVMVEGVRHHWVRGADRWHPKLVPIRRKS